MEKIFEIQFTETELYYLRNAINALVEIQKKIPKKMQTQNSEILHSINNKLQEI